MDRIQLFSQHADRIFMGKHSGKKKKKPFILIGKVWDKALVIRIAC